MLKTGFAMKCSVKIKAVSREFSAENCETDLNQNECPRILMKEKYFSLAVRLELEF